tara:strand:+ start:1050 stop:1277 length:228 start_codon:yes stop_codon:yes gene_type:complete
MMRDMKKKKLKKKLNDSNLNFFKTFLASLIIILIFSILPSSINFIKLNFDNTQVVINSSKQSFDEILDKQKKISF